MATFTDVYKQELKSKGVLSSLGSTMFKRTKERLDPRNILFGGSGITSAIGQKIFGKGYSALNKSSSGKTLGDSGMQSQALNALIISSKNQEAQLSIIAKNTMNSNAMARDINVMRQNIMKLVTMGGGKASRGADMFFKDAAARESAYESQFGKSGGTKSTSPSPVSGNVKKEGSSGLLSSLVSAVGAISVAIVTLGTKLVSELGGIIKTALETLGNVLKSALLGTAASKTIGSIPTGGGGGKGGAKGKSRFGLGTGIAGILAGLGIYFSDEIIDYVDKKLIESGLKNPSVEDSLGPGEEVVGDKSTKQTIKDYAKPVGITALAGATAIGASKYISSRGAVQGYNQKAGRFVGSTGKFVSAAETPAGKLVDKLFKFGAKLSSKPGLMSKFLGLVATKIGGSLALKISTFFGGLVVPGPGWILSLLSAGLIIADVYQIYDAIFGPGGIAELMDEDEKAEKKSEVSPTPVKSDEQVRLGMMADAAKASGNSSSSPSKANLLDIIAGGEAGKMGYDAANKGKAGDTPGGMPGLSNMKIGEVMQLQSEGKLFAAGRYQIIPKTLAGLMSGAYGNTGLTINDVFDKATQDKLAQTLIDKRLKQGGTDPIKQQYALSQEFASIANPYTGKSYHAGVGDNKASISTEQIQTALSGGALNQASTAIASAMRESSSQPPIIAISSPTVNNGGTSPAPQTVAAATNIDVLELFFQAAAGVRPI